MADCDKQSLIVQKISATPDDLTVRKMLDICDGGDVPTSLQGNWYYCTETAKPPASRSFILRCGRHGMALLELQIAKN